MAEIPIQRKEGRNIWPMLIGLLVLLAVLWFVFSRRHDADTAAARADSTAVATNGAVTTDSAGGAMANTAATGAAGTTGAASGSGMTGATGSSATLSDADIAGVIHEVNTGEIAAAKLAETKASSSDVKAFARDMVRDHSSLDKQDTKIATGTTSTASSAGARDSVVNANKTTSSQLESAGTGAAFDRAYMDAQVAGHQNALAFLQRAQSQAQGSELKEIVTKAIPDVEKHLARARTIQSKVGQ